MLEDIRNKQEAMKKRYLPSRRHTIQVDYLPFMDELSELIGCTPNIWKIFFRDPYLAWKLIWSPTPSYIYRIRGPHAWSGAKKALLESGDRVKKGCHPRGEVHPNKSNFTRYLPIVVLFLAITFFKWGYQK